MLNFSEFMDLVLIAVRNKCFSLFSAGRRIKLLASDENKGKYFVITVIKKTVM
jgi:hypothetical protein